MNSSIYNRIPPMLIKSFFNNLPLFLLFIFPLQSFSQTGLDTIQKTTLVPATRKVSLNGKLFNASTEKAISMEEFNQLIQENPIIILEHIYNNYGEMEKALYHPEAPNKDYNTREPTKQPKVGEKFPSLVFKTTSGETLAIDNLKDQWIILRFNFFTAMMDKTDLTLFIESLSNIPPDTQFTGILCSLDNSENIKATLGQYSDQLNLVAESHGFMQLLHIITMPTTILISPDKKVVKYLNRDNYSDIPSLIRSEY